MWKTEEKPYVLYHKLQRTCVSNSFILQYGLQRTIFPNSSMHCHIAFENYNFRNTEYKDVVTKGESIQNEIIVLTEKCFRRVSTLLQQKCITLLKFCFCSCHLANRPFLLNLLIAFCSFYYIC